MTGFDEDYWFRGRGWRRLHGLVTGIAADILKELRDRFLVKQFSEAEFASGLMNELISEIERHRRLDHAAQRRSSRENEQSFLATKWDHALVLLSEREKYDAALIKEFSLFVLPTSDEERALRAIRAALKQLLEKSRRKLALATEHQMRVWEKIQPVSDEVHRDNGRLGLNDEITEAHITEVHRRLMQRYPESKNFGLKDLSSVRGYFVQFHPGFLSQLRAEDAPDESFTEVFREELNQTIRLEPCLEQLQKAAPESWEALIIKFKFEDLPETTIENYKAAKALTRTQFDKILNRGLLLMSECIEKTTNFRFRGMI
ncbi:hypothetical protein [Rhizobium chutanense]|uniref:Uncharacterized protein n=1 Tax=Rhizobium chutanense TaxID=2035448 RepID=A0A432P2U8_9HYPH|nr:hypothetical protein [Rhizobium chutanense]RUM06398.1 hypothetical protein EFR84_12270 [Rhizobium chutanense]